MDEKNSILIVDDDTATLMELASILTADYKIYTVKDGSAALEKAKEAVPDLILLDVIMPDMNGFEVLQYLQENEKTCDIPVIFITGATDREAEIRGLATGAVDYIHKPLNESLVRLRVSHQIQLLTQFRRIQHLSMIDQLTGLPNRRSFEMRINEEWDRSLRDHTPISSLMIDIDHFKKYNDRYGHQQGDAALVAVAEMFNTSLKRPADFAARWGGEEFIVLLPNTESRGAVEVAEIMRKQAESMKIPTSDGTGTRITISIGVNTHKPGQRGSIDKFVSWTDMALYDAKNKGRNKVCVFQMPSEKKREQKREIKQNIIFIVDDNETNLTAAEDALVDQYRVIALTSAAKMFEALKKFKPDMILLDIEMPEMNGFEAIKILKSNDNFEEIPVIFLTGLSDAESEADGIELGAVDFIMKPFTKPVLLNRIRKHLDIDELVRERTRQLAHRTEQLARRTEQLERLKNGIVYTLADVVENRDSNTGGHIDRTSMYMSILVDAMISQEVYGDEMKEWNFDSVISSARLHDIGKIAIPDTILNKPDRLTSEEFLIIQSHPEVGRRMIEQMTERTGDDGFLENAMLFAAYHHEKWDGTGYPHGLSGSNIPLHGRIMAVIDVYDALVSDRPYKKAFSHDKAVQIIMEDAGSHFDPAIAEAFNKISDEIKTANDRFTR